MSDAQKGPTVNSPVEPPRLVRPSPVRWRSGFRWFAAEFLVVLSGVLVALLVNAWWEGRQLEARERQALERLYEESEAIVRYFDGVIAAGETRIRETESAARALATDSAGAPPLEEFRRGVFFAFTYPAVNPPRSVYDEVTQAGLFGGLSSVEVRSVISDYYGTLDWIQSQLLFFRQTAQPGIELTMSLPYAYSEDSPGKMAILVDPASLRSDARLRSALVFGLRNQIAFHTYRRQIHEEARKMCETLAEAVGRECAPSQ